MQKLASDFRLEPSNLTLGLRPYKAEVGTVSRTTAGNRYLLHLHPVLVKFDVPGAGTFETSGGLHITQRCIRTSALSAECDRIDYLTFS